MATARKKAPAKRKTGTRAKTTSSRTKKAGTRAKKKTTTRAKAPKPPKAPTRITSKTTDLQCVRIVEGFASRVGDFMEKRAKYRAKLEGKKTKKLLPKTTTRKRKKS